MEDGKTDGGAARGKLVVVGSREAARAELAQAVAEQSEYETKTATFKGQRNQTPDGTIWSVGIMVPSGMVGRPIKILCAAGSGIFTLFGEVPKVHAHEWLDVTVIGDVARHFRCASCHAVREEPLEVNQPEGGEAESL
jgi:hypothetical protein